MTEPRYPTEPRRRGGLAGGIFVALGLIIGVVAGTFFGQPSLGMVAGAGIGLVLLLLVWLLDRR
jgi:uncharacterized membrane protein YccC